jgi:Flp pilus assembly protein TadG
MTTRPELRDQDRGSATLELVVLGPALLAVLGAVLVAGRFEAAAGAVEQASAAAARAASLARTPSTAQQAARRAARDTLDERGLHCTGLDVDVQTTSPRTGAAGTRWPGQSAVTVTCTLDLSAIAFPGVAGTRRISGRTVSVRDVYRSEP